MKKKIFWILFSLILFLAGFLRFYGVTKFPPSLYWEEVALGYDAYSVLKTGKDHHGNPFPIVAFESFGDWKPSLYFYTLVPFIWVFGLTEIAVRLPSVLAGMVIVVASGFLTRFFITGKKKDFFQLLTMFLMALSPWAVQFSRAGWEVNLATALILTGVVLFFRSMEKKKESKKTTLLLISSATLLGLSMFAYHAARIIAPLLGLGLAFLWLRDKKEWSKLLIPGFVALILISPILLSLGSNQTSQRFTETSIFSDLSIIEESNSRKQQAGNTFLSRVFYHRYLLFSKEILINFADHFKADFLFISGDSNPRHSVQFIGTFYHLELIFLLLGFFVVFSKRNNYHKFLLWWLFIGILPAALTKTTPHSLRILPTLPAWILLITLGIKEFIGFFKKYKRAIILMILIAYLAELVIFWRFYSRIYPEVYKDEWQYGYKEMILDIEKERLINPSETIFVSREKGRPAIFYWFYTQTDPNEVQKANHKVKKDQGEFLEFENLKFVDGLEENFHL